MVGKERTLQLATRLLAHAASLYRPCTHLTVLVGERRYREAVQPLQLLTHPAVEQLAPQFIATMKLHERVEHRIAVAHTRNAATSFRQHAIKVHLAAPVR